MSDWVKNCSILLLVFGIVITVIAIVKVVMSDFDLLIRSYFIVGLFSILYPALYLELLDGVRK